MTLSSRTKTRIRLGRNNKATDSACASQQNRLNPLLLVALGCTGWLCACSPNDQSVSSQSQEIAEHQTSQHQAEETSLAQPDPDLTTMDPQVARQLSDARQKIADSAPSELTDQRLGDLAKLYHAYDLLEAADQLYRQAEAKNPEASEWSYYRAMVAERQGRFDDAAKSYESAHRHLSEEPEYQALRTATAWRLGRALRSTPDADQASAWLEKAAREGSNSCPASRFELGQIALEEDRPAEAVDHFRKVLEIQPDAEQAYFPLGRALRASGQSEESETYLALAANREVSVGGRAFCLDPLDAALGELSTGAAAWITRGQHARFAGDSKGAMTAFHEAVRLAPEDPIAHQALAKGAAEMGDWAQAVRHFRKAAELDPGSPSLTNDLAVSLLGSGEPAEALVLVEDLLNRFPFFVPALSTSARIKTTQGDLQGALTLLDRALEISDQSSLRSRRAQLLGALGRQDEAVHELTKLLDEGSSANPSEHLRLAMTLGRLGGFDLSRHHFEQICRNPGAAPRIRAQAHLALAGLLLRDGHSDKAEDRLKEAIALDPSLQPAQAALREIQARRQND